MRRAIKEIQKQRERAEAAEKRCAELEEFIVYIWGSVHASSQRNSTTEYVIEQCENVIDITEVLDRPKTSKWLKPKGKGGGDG